MFLFTRAVALGGTPRAVRPFLQKVTDHVRQATSLDITVWAAEFGFPIGTFMWNATVESQAAFDAATAPLLDDDAYFDILETGQDLLLAPAEDSLRSLVHGTPAEGTPPLGAVATVTTAVVTMDRVADAMAWSVDMAIHVEKLIDSPVTCWTSAFGQMGEVTWISVLPDLTAGDGAMAAMNSDEGYISRLHETGDLFIPGSGRIARFRRVY